MYVYTKKHHTYTHGDIMIYVNVSLQNVMKINGLISHSS